MFELQRSGTPRSISPRDVTGVRAARLNAQKTEREQAEAIAQARSSGKPGSELVMSYATACALAEGGGYEDGDLVGVSERGQAYHYTDGIVICDARVAVEAQR